MRICEENYVLESALRNTTNAYDVCLIAYMMYA